MPVGAEAEEAALELGLTTDEDAPALGSGGGGAMTITGSDDAEALGSTIAEDAGFEDVDAAAFGSTDVD